MARRLITWASASRWRRPFSTIPASRAASVSRNRTSAARNVRALTVWTLRTPTTASFQRAAPSTSRSGGARRGPGARRTARSRRTSRLTIGRLVFATRPVIPTPSGSRATPDLFAIEPVRRGEGQAGAIAIEQVDRADLRDSAAVARSMIGPHELVPGPGRRRQPGDLLEEGELARRRASRSVERSGIAPIVAAGSARVNPPAGGWTSRAFAAARAYRNGDRAATCRPPSRARLATDGGAARAYGERPIRTHPPEDRAAMPDRQAQPLYDPRFEHDACGVGFVADAGGRSRSRVLPLALAGLGALAHRGAFGADGASCDGAGAPAPARPDACCALLGTGRRRPAGRGLSCSCLVRPRARGRPARGLVEAALIAERLSAPTGGWCRPIRPRSAGRPTPVGRPSSRPSSTGRRACSDAPVRAPARRRPTADGDRGAGAGRPGRVRRPVGVVPHDRLQGPRRRRPPGRPLPGPARAGIRVRYALFHQRYATNTQPTGGSPSRSGRSPTTARSTRSAATATRSAAGPATRSASAGVGRELTRAPARSSPPTAPTRSRSTRRSSCSSRRAGTSGRRS